MLTVALRDRTIEAIGRDHQFYRFDASLNETARTAIDAPTGMMSAVFSPDGKQMALTDDRGRIRQGPVGGPFREIADMKEVVTGPAISTDGSLISVISTVHNTTKLQEPAFKQKIMILKDGQPIAEILGEQDHFSPAMAFSPDQKFLAVGLLNIDNPGPTVRLYDVSTGKPDRTFGLMGSLTAMAFSPDGKRLATALGKGGSIEDPTVLAVLNVADGSVVAQWSNGKPRQSIRSLAFDGSSIIVAPSQGPLQAFTLDQGRLVPR